MCFQNEWVSFHLGFFSTDWGGHWGHSIKEKELLFLGKLKPENEWQKMKESKFFPAHFILGFPCFLKP